MPALQREPASRFRILFQIFFLSGSLLGGLPVCAQKAAPTESLAKPLEEPPKQPLPPPEAFKVPQRVATQPHRFLDRTNLSLFAGIGVTRMLDYTSTGNARQRGHDEILLTNEIVDNKPLFATIELGVAAASIGTSYWLHRSGHHKLERWVSIVHISAAGFSAAHNYGLETAHAPPGVP